MAGVEGCEDKFERHLSILSKVCSQESRCVLQWGILSHLSGPLIPRVGAGGGEGWSLEKLSIKKDD